MGMLVQLALVCIWGTALGIHGWRLLRLARIHQGWDRNPLRDALQRAWFWLGREEFWAKVQRDSALCLQLTLMLFVLAWTTL